jgi:hypothetical protein
MQHEVVALALYEDVATVLVHPILARGVVAASELANLGIHGPSCGFRAGRIRRYRPSAVAAVIAVVLFAAWAIVLDAATHGWDDCRSRSAR